MNESGDWRAGLGEREQEDITAAVELPMEHGPRSPFPCSSGVEGARHRRMRGRRIRSGSRPVRVYPAFDPRRTAILVIGGDRTGDGRSCDRLVPLADGLHGEHVMELKDEGSIQ